MRRFFCSRDGYRQRQTVIHKLGHVIKESKRGLLDGLTSRWDMTREVFFLHFDLYLFQSWRDDDVDLPVAAEYDLFE